MMHRQAYLQRLGIQCGDADNEVIAKSNSGEFAAVGAEHASQDPIRGRFLQKLAYNKVWVPQAQRPPKHQTVILFDWDDTLLCTSWLNDERHQNLTKDDEEYLRKVALRAKDMLEKAIASGNTYIITNAKTGWVEYSAARWVPELLPTLRRVRVISARDKYEQFYPTEIGQWKVQAFLEVQRQLEYTPIANLIALGDAEFEMEAAQIMGSQYQEAFVKTVKFRPQPSCAEHLMEMQLVADKFDQILSSARNLKVSLERKAKQTSTPSPQ